MALIDVIKSMILGGGISEEKGFNRASNWGHIETHVSICEQMDDKQILTKELKNAAGRMTVSIYDPLEMYNNARNICSGLARHGVPVRYVEESITW